MNLSEVPQEILEEAMRIKTVEDLRLFWIKYGLLNEFSGEFQGYGLIRIDENWNMSNEKWELKLDPSTPPSEMARFGEIVYGHCNEQRLYDMSTPETYALYMLAERDTILLAVKNSRQPGLGRRVFREFERTSQERGSQYTTVMGVRQELDGYVRRYRYVPFRELVDLPAGASKRCYIKQNNDGMVE